LGHTYVSLASWKFCARGNGRAALRYAVASLGAMAALLIGASSPTAVDAAEKAEAAQRPPFSMAVFLTSKTDDCYDAGAATAIKRLARHAQNRINREGGIAGRRLVLNFFDDQRDAKKAAANLASAISDPQTVAMIGLSNSTRAKAAFDAAGKDLKASGIPFISDISVGGIFADYPNVFTTRASEDEERMPVLTEFVKQMHFERPAFVGLQDSVASSNLGDALKKFLGPTAIVADHRLKLTDEKLDAGDVTAAVADLKAKNADLVFLSVGSSRTADVLKQLKDAQFTPPLFATGRIDALLSDPAGAYANNIYQLAWDGLPELYNDRLRKLVSQSPNPNVWIFGGAKNSAASGWKNGQCKPKDDDVPPNVFDEANMRALSTGTRYADVVSLVATAARSAAPTASLRDVRALIIQELGTTYASGRGTFKGRFDNWSFQPASRAAASTPLIVMLPRGLGRTQLAPMQFVHLRDQKLRRIDTLYADIDLIRAEHIDDNDKTFFADFYLSMNDRGGASIDQIEFSNAYLEPGSNDRQITIRTIHDGGKSEAFPDHMKIYQVSGKFMYEPQFRNYPFDTQRFSIDIQPKSSNAPFIVQPPPANLRDANIAVDGWEPRNQYVGYDEDFVRTVDAQTLVPSVVPFYKASFVWQMARQTTDYFLRVVVPLGFILSIAYLSFFIVAEHFEAIVTIQVTALLSAVALYLSLPKIDANAETLSDRIFLFSYLVLSVIIAVTIARANVRLANTPWARRMLGFAHIVIVPAMVAAMAFYVYEVSVS
jgi:hypothetical protein